MKEIRKIIEDAIAACKHDGILKAEAAPDFTVEPPKQAQHGDLSTNVALMMSKAEGLPPRKIAEALVAKMPVPSDTLTQVDIAGPGFINFKINPLLFLNVLHTVAKEGENFGRLTLGRGKKVQVEFVSANPTGPLHVGHGRGAVYGDALSRLLSFAGYEVTKEYYLNDAGVQMKTLGLSVLLRLKELRGEKIEFPENCYQGAYIKDIAAELLSLRADAKQSSELDLINGIASSLGLAMTITDEQGAIAFCGSYAGQKIHNEIVRDLADCKVTHDVFFNESDLHKSNAVEKTVDFLRQRGDAYDSEGAIWFKSTNYGDEKDRVLKKSDGYFTYFAADIAYHKEKFDRGFNRVIDVWGADHAGHVPRMKAAIKAIGYAPENFDVVLIQLVNLIKGGELVSMSTRSAQYETLRKLIDEVGSDVCRYFFLMRSQDSQLDFDIDLATQHTMDNPVYYIQYAHARIESVFEKAKAIGVSIDENNVDLKLLNLPEELLLARELSEWPDTIELAANELAPHRVTYYLLDLARKFQSYYTKGRTDSAYRFLHDDPSITSAKCYLLKNIQTVLKNGLNLLGLSAPKRMESPAGE